MFGHFRLGEAASLSTREPGKNGTCHLRLGHALGFAVPLRTCIGLGHRLWRKSSRNPSILAMYCQPACRRSAHRGGAQQEDRLREGSGTTLERTWGRAHREPPNGETLAVRRMVWNACSFACARHAQTTQRETLGGRPHNNNLDNTLHNF